MKGAGALCLALLFILPSAARAQPPVASPSTTDQKAIDFLTAYRFRMGASRLAADDQEFIWDGRLSGDVDLLRAARTYLNFFAEYGVILGNERRHFDPNQSLYTLDLRITQRFGPNDVTGVLHHVSRHLSDRAKAQAVDWNAVGAEVARTESFGGVRIESLVRASRVIKRSYADYTWQFGGRTRIQRPLRARTTLIGEGTVDFFGTDPTIAGRDAQVGAYLEGGTRFTGRGGSVDVFVAFQRWVDADPLVRGPRSWMLVGFRLLGP
jgi:hypothetical protein